MYTVYSQCELPTIQLSTQDTEYELLDVEILHNPHFLLDTVYCVFFSFSPFIVLVFNRLGVARAVLQTASLLTD